MTEKRICILEDEMFEIDGLEDHKPDLDSIEIFVCSICGRKHRYNNGRPTLGPIIFECGYCGEDIEKIIGGGGIEYCDSECQNKALHEAMEFLNL